MVNGVGCGVMVTNEEWSYAVCEKGVGRNSFLCCV